MIKLIGSQRKAAEIAGVTDEQVAKWRNGKAKPPLFAMVALATAANVSLDWLVGRTGDPTETARNDEDILSVCWNVAYFIAKKSDYVDVEPTSLAEAFVALFRYSTNRSAEDGPLTDEQMETLVDFATERLKRR